MFFIDAPIAHDINVDPEASHQGSEIDYEQDLEQDSDHSDHSSRDSSDIESDSELPHSAANASAGPSWLTSKTSSSKTPSKPALWSDPSDSSIHLNLATAPTSRIRKLARGLPPSEPTTVDGKSLESKLRVQFQRIHPEPEWAVQSKSDRKSLKSKSASSSSSSTLDPLQALFSTTASFIAPTASRGALPKGSLEVRRLRDANYQNRVVWEGGNAKKKVKSPGTTVGSAGVEAGGKSSAQGQGYVDTGMVDVKFHPKVGVLAAVGADRRLRLFNVSLEVASRSRGDRRGTLQLGRVAER